MKWALCGILFALAVALAIATAAVRAENARTRHRIELEYRAVWDRVSEFRRLSVQKLQEASPDRLAEAHWAHLRKEAARREGQVQ
ncbi:MAG: hypothetical protein JNK15_17375 [Planctomycetes bacterium]|nr:hypothetical protein [Planctomycetota bacterium]